MGSGFVNFSIFIFFKFILPKFVMIFRDFGVKLPLPTQISRALTVPIALVQGFAFLKLLENSSVITHISSLDFFINLMIIVGGSMLMMWIGELMTEFGIGNGTSLLIFAGIVARLPTTITQMSLSFSIDQIPMYIILLAKS